MHERQRKAQRLKMKDPLTETAPLDVRADFPCLHQRVNGQPLVYLDSAATALKPQCVIDAVCGYYTHDSANVHRGVYALSERATAAYERARDTVQSHLNARSRQEIVFTSGATDGINLVAHSFGRGMLAPGDEVLITGMEHHSNIVPWQQLRDQCGVVLKMAPLTGSGELDRDAFRRLLSERTRLVAFTAVSNALGTVNPVAELVEEARSVGARTLVDAAQAVPTQAVDVQAWGCDFLVFSGHKVFGPTGIGVLYGREALLEAMPPFRGGGDMILKVTLEQTTYNELPYKFEAGTGAIASAIGLGSALRYVGRLGYEAIDRHEFRLLKEAEQRLRGAPGVRLIGEPALRRGAISFDVEGVHPHDLATLLDREGVAIRAGHHCAQPVMAHFGVAATARASFSIYNTAEDIERLVAGIARARKLFA